MSNSSEMRRSPEKHRYRTSFEFFHHLWLEPRFATDSVLSNTLLASNRRWLGDCSKNWLHAEV